MTTLADDRAVDRRRGAREPRSHCCERMQFDLDRVCEQHPNRSDCPDMLVSYSERFDEYGLIVHDGGLSSISIHFCPWCGARLPESRRDDWFDALEALGWDDPLFDDTIPETYKTAAWRLPQT